mgnify:CR=1 FL=1
MPLNQKQISIISEQLKEENASEFVETLVLQYASDVDRTSHLLSLIPKISEKQLKITKKEVIEQSLATSLLIGTINKKQNIDFATLMYVSKARFPEGNCNGGSPADKMFFEKFIEVIKTKKGFDYESEADWDWICKVANCETWMRSVIRQNIEDSA